MLVTPVMQQPAIAATKKPKELNEDISDDVVYGVLTETDHRRFTEYENSMHASSSSSRS